MATKTKQDKTISTNNFIIVAALVSLLAVMATVLVGRILVDQALFNNKIIAKKSSASKQLKANLDVLPQLTSNYQNLGAIVQIVRDALPVTADFPGLVSSMGSITAISGVSLKSIDSAVLASASSPAAAGSTAGPATGPQSTFFTASIGGSYSSLLVFLQNLETSARPMRITDITLAGSASTLQADLQITSYYQPAASIEPKTEAVK